jgi:hypothetical protein
MKITPLFLSTLLSVLFFFVALAAYAGPKLLTTDPLTGLSLYPPTDSRLRLGNDPIQLPESNVCKSKTQADLDSVYDSKVDATLAWYASRLSGFKKTHAYTANRLHARSIGETILGMNQQTIVCPDRSGNRSNRMFEWSQIRN